MMYIAWAFFFVVLLFGLFIVAFKLRRRYGFLVMLLFLLLVAFLFSRTEISKTESGEAPETARLVEDSVIIGGSVQEMKVTLEEGILADLNLNITYGKLRGSGQSIPIKAHVTPEGWQIGTSWTTKKITLNPDGFGATFSYRVSGDVEWKIPFITLVTQGKEFSGAVNVKLKNKMDTNTN